MEILYTKDSALANRFIEMNGYTRTSIDKNMADNWDSVKVDSFGYFTRSKEFTLKRDAIAHAKQMASHYNLTYVSTF